MRPKYGFFLAFSNRSNSRFICLARMLASFQRIRPSLSSMSSVEYSSAISSSICLMLSRALSRLFWAIAIISSSFCSSSSRSVTVFCVMFTPLVSSTCKSIICSVVSVKWFKYYTIAEAKSIVFFSYISLSHGFVKENELRTPVKKPSAQ